MKQVTQLTREKRLCLPALCVLALFAVFSPKTQALVLTPYFESILVPDVSTAWTTVALDNTYVSAIPVCTYVLGTFAGSNPVYTNVPAVTRIRNIGSNSFQLRVQGWENAAASTADVHCMVMDEGAHTLPDGRLVEAHSVVSDQTNGQYSSDGGWSQALLENVSASVVHSYTSPVVVGQVMSYNDPRASVIYVSDCDSRQNHPFQSGMADGICVGKHIGQIAGSRADETIGYIIGESGSGVVNNVFYELARGADSVAGNNGSNSGYSYPMAKHHTMSVLTQAAEDGGNGSWAVLYGASPLSNNAMGLAVDEEIVVGGTDFSRNHTAEQVYYWAFAGAELTLVKNVINDEDGTATIADFTLTATGTSTISGTSGTTSVTKAVVQPGTYTLTESTMPGYTAGAWSCTGASSVSGNTVELVGGDHAICSITNDDSKIATLTLQKALNNDAGGTAVINDFTLAFSGPSVSGSGLTNEANITSVPVAAGNYRLSESPVPGYTLESIKCDGSDPDGTDGLDIQPGEKVTCIFNNNDRGVNLSIAKSVSNDSPNIGDVLTFTLLITNSGPDVATDVHVLDPVPAGFSYVPSTISGGDYQDDTTPTGVGLDWTINTLAPSSSVSLTFQAAVLAP